MTFVDSKYLPHDQTKLNSAQIHTTNSVAPASAEPARAPLSLRIGIISFLLSGSVTCQLWQDNDKIRFTDQGIYCVRPKQSDPVKLQFFQNHFTGIHLAPLNVRIRVLTLWCIRNREHF
jgi:hypothetical protein